MIKKVLLILMTIGMFVSLSGAGGSVYSRYGAGDIYHLHSARRLGMGTPVFAGHSYNDLDNVNPASWTGIKLTRLQAGLFYQGTNMDDGNNKAFYSDYDFSGFLFGIPVDRDYGISIVAGLSPYSKVSYEVIDNSNADYTFDYVGSGGISKIFIGSSYTTPIGVTIGASFEYYTGKTQYSTKLDFEDNSEFRDALFLNKSSYYGNGYKFGLLSPNLSEYLGEKSISDLRIGGFYSKINPLNTDTTLIINSSIGTSELEKGLIESKFPASYGVGASATFSQSYLVALDYSYEPWTEYSINGVKVDNMQDVSRYSLGFEYKNLDSQFGTFWEQMAFRCGLSYETLKYVLNSEKLNQFSIHAGFSMPLGVANDLDFGFSYSRRGTNSSNLVKEDLYNFAITLNFGELWFVRQDR